LKAADPCAVAVSSQALLRLACKTTFD